MRGSLRKRYGTSWSAIIERDYQLDPTTGGRKRKQQWVTLKGTKQEVEKKFAELVNDQNKGNFVAPTKRTFGEWLSECWTKVIKATKTPRTADTYDGVITNHLRPKLGAIRLQQLKSIDLEAYYAQQRPALSESTLQQHHMIISGALKAAAREGLVARNVATLVNAKPKPADGHADEVEQHCWTAEDARAFLDAAKNTGDQQAAFYALALETGMRKSELGGLKWTDIDLATAVVRIQRQIVTLKPPTYGLPKGKKPRTVRETAETVALLRRHKTHQAELKLNAAAHYHDHGLVFAKEWPHVNGKHDTLGDALSLNNIGQREFARLTKMAGVRPIKFHGLRHTSATLALEGGVSAKVVQERLGHKKIMTTLDIYAHRLPAMDQAAADSIGAVIHGHPRRTANG
jgi:integrase